MITETKLKQLYWQENLSLQQMEEKLGISNEWLRKKMIKYGIPRRTRSAAGRIYSINEDFFKVPSPEREWVLGFIYADGTLNKLRNRIYISQKDPEVLHKIKALLQSEHPIKKLRKIYNEFYFTSKEMYQDLLKIGLTPNKSLTMIYPKDIVYHSHFVRGFFDGDGCITYNIVRKIHKYQQIFFVSGSRKFLEELNNHLPTQTKIHFYSRAFRLQFSNKKARSIIRFMYKGSTDLMRYSIKYNKCKRW